ncbi:MAG TPA: hypothetical protein DCW71_05135 [Alistipes sp.]|nr:hypothetical protein [Alistipes sp.]
MHDRLRFRISEVRPAFRLTGGTGFRKTQELVKRKSGNIIAVEVGFADLYGYFGCPAVSMKS